MDDLNKPGKVKPEELIPTGFRRARRKAESYLQDKDKATELLDRARAKAAGKKGALAGVWDDLQILFRLLKNWISGSYPGASWQTIVMVITAILYFVMPFDVIPDFIAVFGFFDDAAIIAYIVSNIKDELVTFTQWELLMTKSESSHNGPERIEQTTGEDE